MNFLYLMILFDYMVFGSKKNAKKNKNSIRISSCDRKTEEKAQHLHSIAIYIKGYKSLPLRIKNLKEMNYIAKLYSKNYVSKILSEENLKNNIFPKLVSKINEYDHSIFEKNNRKIYILCCFEIHNILREKMTLVFHSKFDSVTNLFFDKIFESIKNIKVSTLDEMETKMSNANFSKIEYCIGKIKILTKESEFTKSFILNLNEISSAESNFIKGYVFNILFKILSIILLNCEDYQITSTFLEKKDSTALNLALDSNDQIIFTKGKIDAKFLEDGRDNAVIFNEIGRLIIESSKFLTKEMTDLDFSEKTRQNLIFNGLDSCNIFELNPEDAIESVRKKISVFLKSNILRKLKISNEISPKTKIYLVIDLNKQIIQCSEFFLLYLHGLKSSLDRSKIFEELNDLNSIRNILSENNSLIFKYIQVILNVFHLILEEIDKKFNSSYEICLLFEDLASIDLEHIIKQHISNNMPRNPDSEKPYIQSFCDKKIKNVKSSLISIFILLLRDYFEIKFCNRSPKLSLKIENFSNEMSLEESLKVII
ncbi:hypothetical protein CWI38_0487p0030 [Hamiltosporidium tvaerminnensis]|uniref:Uncharacterized protein n=1 Tax=Hamiltosporidium tvaerminnensis TaxID=1176355 RepID=A0A4Q9LZR4_9MICR|nr:hypothetical protein CWI38_0487p0030 [Hamiltosporidium tvaerminnensis]